MAVLQPAPSPLAPPPVAASPVAPPPAAPAGAVPVPTPRPDPNAPPGASPGAPPVPANDPSQQTESVTSRPDKTPDAAPFTKQGLANKFAEAEHNAAAIDEATGAMKPPQMDAPVRKKDVKSNPLEIWGSVAMLAAGVGSMFTRAPLTTALNSAAAVMNAYQAGDEEEAKRNFAEFKEANELAAKKYQYQNDAYKTVLEKLKTDRAAGFAAATAYGSALGHTAMVDAASQRNADAIHRLANDDKRLSVLLAKNYDKIAQNEIFKGQQKALLSDPNYINADPKKKMEMMNAILPAGAVPQAGIDLIADTFMKSGKFPYGLTKEMKERVMAAVGRMTALKNSKGTSNEQIIADQGTYKGDLAALAVLKKNTTMSSAFERVTRKNMEVAEKMMPKGAAGTDLGPFFNQWLQEGRTTFGDKKVPAFEGAMITIANEYAKIQSGATGSAAATEGSRAEAAALVNRYYSKGQIKELFAFMRTEMRNKTSLYYEEQRALRRDMAQGMFDTPEDVGEAIRAGQIDADDGHDILVEQFGFDP